MSEHQWVTLLDLFDRLEAEIMKEALEAQGIPAQLFQEGISHYLYPVGGPMGRIQVCVPDQKLQEARNWLEAYNHGDLLDESPEHTEPSVDPQDDSQDNDPQP